jgi:HK97 family phage prohead protease
MGLLEHKTLALESIELKGAGFVGLASERSLDLVGDIITPNAYDEWHAAFTAGRKRVTLNMDHGTKVLDVVGLMTGARILSNGLEGTFEYVPSDPTADAARKRVEMGAVNSLSIGYHIRRYRQPTSDERKSGVLRVLESVDISEVSLVQNPAQPRAIVIRSQGKAERPATFGRHEAARRFDLLSRPDFAEPPRTDRRMSREDQRALRENLKRLRGSMPASAQTERECRDAYHRVTLGPLLDAVLRRSA